MELFISPRVAALIELALEEDEIGFDATSQAFFGADSRASARLIARQELVMCGAPVAKAVFRRVDETVRFEAVADEKTLVREGEIIATVEGASGSLLRGERTALNFLQRMCGVATLTREFVEALGDDQTRVADTRKTLPGWRLLDKYAVRCGGGYNHRYNLSAGVMIKENHIAAAGGIAEAIEVVRRHAPHTLRVEVEVETLKEVEEALEGGAEIILLDNMNNQMMKEAVQIIRDHRRGKEVVIEGSGNMDKERLRGLSEVGLDVVSVGALTHSVSAADISMLID